MKIFTKEVKIAIVAIVGLITLYFGMNFLKGLTLFSHGNTYHILFNNVNGLSSSSPILANGFKVGTVTSIDYDYEKRGNIVVDVGIDENLKLPEGTVAEIASDLLGNVQVNLIMPENVTTFIQPDGNIEGRVNAGAMGKVMEMVPKIQNMLPKLDSILASVNYILADPALPNTLHHAEQVTSDLTKTTRQMNALLADVGKEVPGLMGKADGVLGKAAATMDNANVATQKLAQLDLESSLNELTVTLNNLKQFTEQLNNDQGALGALLKDRSLYDNLNKTINSADSLLVNFKEHPKRYIHFSVFGKKDK